MYRLKNVRMTWIVVVLFSRAVLSIRWWVGNQHETSNNDNRLGADTSATNYLIPRVCKIISYLRP